MWIFVSKEIWSKKLVQKILAKKILSQKIMPEKIGSKIVRWLLMKIMVPSSPRHRVKCPVWFGKGGGVESLVLDKPAYQI